MMAEAKSCFFFGQPVLPRRAVADGQRDVFVLGAYPSALHVEWTPPSPHRPVRALAVDNEPEPFWNGAPRRTIKNGSAGSAGALQFARHWNRAN